MGLFSNNTTQFFSKTEEKDIVAAIKDAEQNTSAEIRVHLDKESTERIEERAVYVFKSLGMSDTKLQNGVLIYVNPTDKQFLILGDKGIHEFVGQAYWEGLSAALKENFKQQQYADGIIKSIKDIGKELKKYFPFDASSDQNEIDDEISFEA